MPLPSTPYQSSWLAKVRAMCANPWKRIADLEREALHFDQWMDEMEHRLREAEQAAFYKAQEHFNLRTRDLQAHNEALMRRMVDLAALAPMPSPIFRITPKGSEDAAPANG